MCSPVSASCTLKKRTSLSHTCEGPDHQQVLRQSVRFLNQSRWSPAGESRCRWPRTSSSPSAAVISMPKMRRASLNMPSSTVGRAKYGLTGDHTDEHTKVASARR